MRRDIARLKPEEKRASPLYVFNAGPTMGNVYVIIMLKILWVQRINKHLFFCVSVVFMIICDFNDSRCLINRDWNQVLIKVDMFAGRFELCFPKRYIRYTGIEAFK